MQHLFILFFLSSFLHAQQTLSEVRAEENLFLLKIIGVVILILIAMPFVIRKFKQIQLAQQRELEKSVPKKANSSILLDEDEPVKKRGKKPQKEEIVVDPIIAEIEKLLYEHSISTEEQEVMTPLFRCYLDLQKGKVAVQTGSFDLNTVLNNVMSKVHKINEERNFEIVFDIDANVPPKIIGDEPRLEEILLNLIKNSVLKSNAYLIELKIRRLELDDSALHLEFYIPYTRDNYVEDKEEIFTPLVSGKVQSSLELYIAKAYAELMHGEIAFERVGENDSAFVTNVKVYMPNPNELRHYRLPSTSMINHAVLIVDDHSESAIAVKKMFEYFKNSVDVLSSKELFLAIEMLEDYDIVVIQERFYARKLNEKIKMIKSERIIKAVSLNRNEGYEHSDPSTLTILDGELSKPVTVQKVFDLLVSLYQE